jgi:hypothetical protein
MAAATFRFMQDTAKTAMRRVLGIRGGQGETLVPPTAVAGGDEGFVFESEVRSIRQQQQRLTMRRGGRHALAERDVGLSPRLVLS